MRFRFCCTCEDEEKPKTAETPEIPVQTIPQLSPQTVLPQVITQQPKPPEVQPIQLDRITEVSVEESSVHTKNDEQHPIPAPIARNEPTIHELPPSPVQAPRNQNPPKPRQDNRQDDISTAEKEDTQSQADDRDAAQEKVYQKYLDMIRSLVEQPPNPPVTQPQPHPNSNQEPDFSVDTTIGNEKLHFYRIAPDSYRGTFKGSQFHIIQGDVQDDYFVFTESEKAQIKSVYNEAMKGMQLGMKELAGINSGLHNQEAWNPPPNSTINSNYVTRRGEKAIMTFKPIGQGHFQSTYEGKDFAILNGRLLTDDRFDEQDKQLILHTYNNTLLGMQRGLLGMKRGMLGMQRGMLGMQASALAMASGDFGAKAYSNAVGGVATAAVTTNSNAQASYNLTTGRETLRRMRSLNNGKRISLLDAGWIAQPRESVTLKEDFLEKQRNFDVIDGSKLAEPVLQKTTFTPKAIIYDDPKTYEKQDKNELPLAKPLDDFIISMDENFNLTNRFHFHQARPKRVIRRALNSQEKFRLQSPERYSLFEEQCLKLHNQYRKIHGVPPLVHNEFLSQVAKEWAEHLALKDAFYHRPNNEYGENLYYSDGMSCHAGTAVKAWYDEIDLYDYDNPKFSKEVGHFTQLVWKDTREVGTGVAQIGNKMWVCCNYHPPGNYLDKMNDEFVPRPVVKRFKMN